MKYFVSVLLAMLVVDFAGAATPATGRGRASMSNQMMAAPRTVASKNQISAASTFAPDTAVQSKSSLKADDLNANIAIVPDEMVAGKKDMREKEKKACLGNNIGIGNTFVWASRYSNTGNYATMVEDVEEPENNTCFVKVELKSTDNRISVADVPAKYYEMGQNITCGDWADYDKLKQRILDAKKKGRTWATIGGAAGGAAIGVGAMEAFGNRLIGGKVMGQKQFEEGSVQQVRAQLNALKKDNPTEYKRFEDELKKLKAECEKDIWTGKEKPDSCTTYEAYFTVL